VTVRRKTGGRQLTRVLKNWESGEIMRKHKGEKRKEKKKQTERRQMTQWSREHTITIVFTFSKPGMFSAILSSCK
jgi:hypothetical protein